jgi:chromate transporter
MSPVDHRLSHPGGASRKSPRQVALLFLKLGLIGFGGPAAHIAMMHEEVVNRRGWFSTEEFLDLVGATNLIPGPNSTELAIHIGHRQAGWPGFLLAGGCFILPPAIIVTFCALAYLRYGSVPESTALLYGVKPVIIAIVLHALGGLARTAIKTNSLAVICAAGVVLGFAGLHELAILSGAAVASGLGHWSCHKCRHHPTRGSRLLAFGPAAFVAQVAATVSITGPVSFSIWGLFFFFLKVGSVLFGSGYVLLAFLRADLVDRYHWLTESQLLDAVAVGQLTPGPVFTTATFIGYVLGGWPGALGATLGIFLPAFLLVAASGSLIPRMRRSPAAGAVLDGVNAASLALMIVVSYELGRAALTDLASVVLAVIGLGLVLLRVNPAWLVLAGAVTGLVLCAIA